jgi:hypothetical protein
MKYPESVRLVDELVERERAWQTGPAKPPKSDKEIEAYLIGYRRGMEKLVCSLCTKGVIDNSAELRAEAHQQELAERYNRAHGHNSSHRERVSRRDGRA